MISLINTYEDNNMMIGPIELLIVVVLAGTFFVGALIAVIVLIRIDKK